MSNMVVNTNVLSLNSHRSLKQVGSKQATSSARLSSGMKINSAADDAAGLAISEKMRAQIRGLDMASKNSQDGISLIQTAEGGMQEIDNMLQKIRELVVQVSNDTNENNDLGTGDRQKVQDEINALVKEIDSMADRVEFNNKTLLNGDYSRASDTKLAMCANKTAMSAKKASASCKFSNAKAASNNDDMAIYSAERKYYKSQIGNYTGTTSGNSLYLQVGANAGQGLSVSIGSVKSNLLGIGDGKGKTNIDVLKDTGTGTSPILASLDIALSYVTTERSKLGATQNRLEYTMKSLDISSENLSAAESRIRDADMAKEMMNLTQSNVLQQAATSMLAQANQAPQSVLQLLG